MDDSLWQEIDAWFARALDRPADQRAGFLVGCENAKVRARVERLLAATDSTGELLASGIDGPLMNALGSEPSVEARRLFPPGRNLLDRYRVVEEIGAGGMGVVFRATDLKLHRDVAIKVVAGTEQQRERLLREARAVATLNHPNLVGVHDVGEVDGVPFLVMELVDGPTLETAPPRSIEEAVAAAVEICDALTHLHDRGLVHRDLKPGNVLRTQDGDGGTLKLTDLGLARSSHGHGLTVEGQILGTPAYMAPEQVRGQTVDARSDLYALGVMLYHWTTGRAPFVADDPLVLLFQHVNAPVVPPRQIRADYPADLEDLVLRLLSKEPGRRPQSAADVSLALRDDPISSSNLEQGAFSEESSGSPLVRGRQALKSGAWTVAFRLLSEAARDGSTEPDDLAGIATAAMWAGHYDDIVPALENAAAAYTRAGNGRGAAAMALELANLHLERRGAALSESWLRRAEKLLVELDEGREHAYAAWVRARFLLVDGHYDRARKASHDVIEIARRVGDLDFEALALLEIGHIDMAEGRYDEGESVLDDAGAMALSGELGFFAAGTVLCGLIFAWRAQGNWGRAAEWTQAQTRWCDREKVAVFPGLCRIHRGELIRMRGELAEAERDLQLGAEELVRVDTWCAAVGFRELGEVRLRRGDLDGAEQAFLRALELGSDGQPGLARLQLAQGHADDALNGLQRALAAAGPSILDAQNRGYVLPTVVTASLATGDRDGAERAVLELEQLAEAASSNAHRAGALTARGELLLADGDASGAAESLQRAWRCWCEMDAPYEGAEVRVKLADALSRSGNPRGARMQLAAALAAFERLGAGVEVARVRHRLDDHSAGDAAPRDSTSRAWAFVEVVRASQLISALGEDAWAEFEGWLVRELGRCCRSHGGTPASAEIRGGFGAGFADSQDAVRCAVEMQRSLREHRAQHGFAPPVRAGIVSGDDEDSVERARELAGIGGPGEILTTSDIGSATTLRSDPVETRPGFLRLRWQEPTPK